MLRRRWGIRGRIVVFGVKMASILDAGCLILGARYSILDTRFSMDEADIAGIILQRGLDPSLRWDRLDWPSFAKATEDKSLRSLFGFVFLAIVMLFIS
jgi:hypothetical protein